MTVVVKTELGTLSNSAYQRHLRCFSSNAVPLKVFTKTAAPFSLHSGNEHQFARTLGIPLKCFK